MVTPFTKGRGAVALLMAPARARALDARSPISLVNTRLDRGLQLPVRHGAPVRREATAR
ncbi:hypothetical protein GCM10012280_56260 [Wenjunlia tyrosinilytica]|uniref:Uncharacterized protein n=1 Tax=Wenjunlia tyrosinilytica TaxID=1544741 RepID=A0A918E1J7_9ACTN|nr:hypothetical protein GCM10012280_56260 [Wenjunlia tyrosinilytica]